MLTMLVVMVVEGSRGSVQFRCLNKPWAELWGVILALQSSDAVHLGVDNLNVVRHVRRLLDGHSGSSPFERSSFAHW